MEERHLKIMFRKTGGNAGKNAIGTSMSIPVSWVRALGISPDDRNLIVTFDGETITIKKETAISRN